MCHSKTRSLQAQILVVAALALVFTTHATSVTEKVIHNFVQFPQGQSPQGKLAVDGAGNLYGATYSGGTYGFGTVFELKRKADGGWSQIVLYSFGGYTGDAATPSCLIYGPDGSLYGCATGGGLGWGAVFKLAPQGNRAWTETVIHSFPYGNDGLFPTALAFDDAGNLFGVTSRGGGSADAGVVFQLTPAGGQWTETILYTFTGYADGSDPVALVPGQAGIFYGVTKNGGAVCTYTGCGVVFELAQQADGTWAEIVLHTFRGTGDGIFPDDIVLDDEGRLYGTTQSGTVFQVAYSSSSLQWFFTALYTFTGGSDGSSPASLTLDRFGNIFGAAMLGGIPTCNSTNQGCGTLFALKRVAGVWGFSVLYAFQTAADGALPWGVISNPDGKLYGATYYGGLPYGDSYGSGTVFELAPNGSSGWTHTVISTFPSGDGGYLLGGLVSDAAGNLYGTTNSGGSFAEGSVFKLSQSKAGDWKEQLLYSFGPPLVGTAYASGNLVFDNAGNLYGVTRNTGAFRSGTVFRLSPDASGRWTAKVLHEFKPNSTDGYDPWGGVIVDAAGNVYGTTTFGGDQANCVDNPNDPPVGCGTVFELSPTNSGAWKETILYNFSDSANDGALPRGLAFDLAGNLYGTTTEGGSGACTDVGNLGCGTIFTLTRTNSGWTFTNIYSFQNGTDQAYPTSGLTLGSNGSFFGTTWGDGWRCCGSGTVFQLTPGTENTWSLTTIYTFQNPPSANGPEGGVSLDSLGNLYGTTYIGGGGNCPLYTSTCGTVFELSPSPGGNWTEQTLYTFVGSPTDGYGPSAPVIVDAAGRLYGTTQFGGTVSSQFGGGTVFEIVP